MAEYRDDQGGQFASDVHRRILGGLSLPDDDYGWTAEALTARLRTDEHTPSSVEEVEDILNDLKDDGLCKRFAGGRPSPVYRMTKKGFDLLTGPIADEPPPAEELAAAAGSQKPQPSKIGGAK